MSGITINLRPDVKANLKALAAVRGVSMAETMATAISEYLMTPPHPVVAPRRAANSSTTTWWYRLDPELQERLEARALIETGPPKGEPGPGRKSYKVGVIRRALDYYLDQLSPDERVRMEEEREHEERNELNRQRLRGAA